MTYEEATKIIEVNETILNRYTLNAMIPHEILGIIVAPEKYDDLIHPFIFERLTKNKMGQENNKDVLIEMNLINDVLRPFVILKLSGNNIYIPLDSYLNSNLFQ